MALIDVNVDMNLGFEEMGVENLVQEIEVKREKRQRRRGRGKKKDDGIEKDSIFRDVGLGNEGFVCVPREGVICYTIKEMVEMRFVCEEEQKKKWVEVYCGLGPEVTEEYDSLIGCKNQKQQITVEFDPRRKCPAASGESYSHNADSKLINGDSADSDMSACIQSRDPIAEEQFCDDDEESDEEYETILRPAFFVSGEPDFDSGPPEDGLEYLRRVRWEAARIPKVKVSKVDKSRLMSEQTAYMPQIPEIAKCPDHLLPLKKWEDTFLSDFSQLRQALSCYENSSDRLISEQPSISVTDEAEITPQLSNCIVETFEELTACGVNNLQSSDTCSVDHFSDQMTSLPSCGSETPDTIESSSCKKVVNDNTGNNPTLSTILNMESVARVSMLRKRIRSLENMSYISKDDCLWVFALCASIDTPLDADTSASFRSLLRKCASLRSQKTEMDDEVMMLNILATISGRYFGQLESGWT
ncbi:hypothetical protein Leryth_001819 [Lithospermum erythrorhizon]|nr:hypothetical protein Leryth_001819 [Lithospermum erythrorhizon]